jgi:hypothetical protein
LKLLKTKGGREAISLKTAYTAARVLFTAFTQRRDPISRPRAAGMGSHPLIDSFRATLSMTSSVEQEESCQTLGSTRLLLPSSPSHLKLSMSSLIAISSHMVTPRKRTHQRLRGMFKRSSPVRQELSSRKSHSKEARLAGGPAAGGLTRSHQALSAKHSHRKSKANEEIEGTPERS